MKIYLSINATLYLLFAIWCTLAPSSAARSLAYVALANAGCSEELVS